MAAEEAHLDALSRTVAKMPGRHERTVVEQTLDVLFEVAASKMTSDADKEILANLRKHVGQVEEDLMRPKPRYIDAFFFPNRANVNKLERYIKMAKKSLMICVFNLTNDVLADAVKYVHEQGVSVRVITDDECMTNKGNDCQALADAGIPVRTDNATQYHMHNKFMVVDGVFLLTGSFNWTFQAGSSNQENLLVVDHPFYIERYTTEFEKLWTEFAPNTVAADEQAAVKIQKAFRGKQARRANAGGQNKN
jgi:cardiolipin hydrolase